MLFRMHPKYYLSQEIFDLEQERIFRKVWLFAGLMAMIPKPGSSIARRIAGLPVVLMNDGGKARAMDRDGMHEYALRQVGSLLMVSFDADPMPLEDQFPAACLDAMQSSSNAFDGEIAVTTWHCKFNWKLIYENLRDPNHVQFLHARSFGNYVDFQIPVYDSSHIPLQPLADVSVSAMRREMRSFSGGGAIAAIPDRRRVPWHGKVDRWGGENDVYYDWLIYPNLHLSSGNSGHSFSIEHHTPLAPGCTDLELIWVMSRKNQPFDDSYQALVANMYGSRQIVGEDVAMLEAIQAGLHNAAPLPMQGAYEHTNRRIQRWYTTLLEADHAI